MQNTGSAAINDSAEVDLDQLEEGDDEVVARPLRRRRRRVREEPPQEIEFDAVEIEYYEEVVREPEQLLESESLDLPQSLSIPNES